MRSVTPNPRKRGFSLPKGCKDLVDLLKPKKKTENLAPSSFRVNGKIRAPTVDVRGAQGEALGLMTLREALNLARQQQLDLVEIDATASPPVCLLIDYGAFRFQISEGKKPGKKC